MAGNSRSGRRDLTATPTPLMEHVRAEPPNRWGPAMQALDLPMKTYVVARVVLGYSQAKSVGTTGSICQEQYRKQQGLHWEARPSIAQALVEELNRRASSGAVDRLANIEKIADDPKVKVDTRLKANEYLLERGAPMAQLIDVRHQHDHQLTISAETLDVLADIEAGFGLKLDDAQRNKARKVLGYEPADVVDAEFTPVAAVEDEWSVPA